MQDTRKRGRIKLKKLIPENPAISIFCGFPMGVIAEPTFAESPRAMR